MMQGPRRITIHCIQKWRRKISQEQYPQSRGVTYNLPTAEYNKRGIYTKDQVLESAKKAAVKTGKQFSVLVTEDFLRI